MQPHKVLSPKLLRPDPELALTPVPIWGLLVWAYRDQGVRFTSGTDEGSSVIAELSGTGAAMLALELGGVFKGVNGGGGSFHRAFCHVDALLVHAHVSALERADAWLVVRTAEAATPPDWDPDVPEIDRFAPYYDEMTGEAVERFTRCKTSHRRIPGTWHCPVRPVPEQGRNESQKAEIRLAARNTFTRWADTLFNLQATINAAAVPLTRWRLSKTVPDPRPWPAGEKQGA